MGGGLDVACCIALALVIGAVRAGWGFLFPSRRSVESEFAPVAERPAPDLTRS